MHPLGLIQEQLASMGIPETAKVLALKWFEGNYLNDIHRRKGIRYVITPEYMEHFRNSIHECLLEELKKESHKKKRGFLHRQVEDLEPLCLLLGNILEGLNLYMETISDKDSILMELLSEKMNRIVEMDELNRAISDIANSVTSLPYPVHGDNGLFEYLANEHVTKPEGSGEIMAWALEYHERNGGKRLPVNEGTELQRKMIRYFMEHDLFKDRTSTFGSAFSGKDLELYLHGQDYSHGFSNIHDREIEKTCQQLHKGILELMEEGEISRGKFMAIPEFPFRYLRKIPLVDGIWIDAEIAAILEWFGMLEKMGYSIQAAPDLHPLAFPVILFEDGEGRVQEKKDPSGISELLSDLDPLISEINDYPWKSCIIRGRKHILLEKYLQWDKKRWDLPYSLYEGFKTGSWNEWVRAMGPGDGKCHIHGIPVTTLDCTHPEKDLYSHDSPFNILDQLTRRRILESLRKKQLISSSADEFITEAGHDLMVSPLSMAGMISKLREDLEGLAVEVIAAKIALSKISRYLFSEGDILSPLLAGSLKEQTTRIHSLVDNYNDRITGILWETALLSFKTPRDIPLIKWSLLFPKGIEISLESMKEEVQQAAEGLIKHWISPLEEVTGQEK